MEWFRNKFLVFVPKSIFFYSTLKEVLFDIQYVVYFGEAGCAIIVINNVVVFSCFFDKISTLSQY